jgi:single-stranded-DNA-specific exonuclease
MPDVRTQDKHGKPDERSLLGRRWQGRTGNTLAALALAQRLKMDPLVAHLLTTRGVEIEDAPAFLEPRLRDALPDPFTLKDMDVVVERLEKALHAQEKIMIFADYDVDGATSSALMYHALCALGLTPQIYIPDRIKEGYGPNTPAMERFKAQGIDLVITLDCGTNAFEPLEAAKKLGLDVIVIDHHEAEPKLPEAVGIINPNRLDMEKSDLSHLAAVGVCFVTLVALFARLRENGFDKPLPSLLNWLDLVALGTVCDVVRLKGLNRAFVAQGLKVMAQRRNVGLCALVDVSGVRERLSAYHLGFVLGPRVNAGGRVGTPDLGVRLLTTPNPQEAKELAQALNVHNEERKLLEALALDQATQQAFGQEKDRCIIVSHDEWHPGVIGIVAGRLKEQFHKPVFVLSFWDGSQSGKGSGRSISGISLGALVHAAHQKGLILGGGGHAMAAGLSLTRDQVAPLKAFCQERLESQGDEPTACTFHDGFLSVEGAHTTLIEALEKVGPFGQGNPAPRFVLTNVWIAKAFPVGKDHLKCLVRSSSGAVVDAMAFRCMEGPLGRALVAGGEAFHLLGTLKKNEWQGSVKAQFIIEDAVMVTDGAWALESTHPALEEAS